MSSHALEQSKFTEMTTKPVPGLIARLAVPTIVSMLVSALLRLLDIGAGAIIGMVPLSWLLLFLLLSLYKPVTECLMHGQTVGKRLMGLRVTAADGSPASAGAGRIQKRRMFV